MSTSLKWYDSFWLEDYLAAKDIIARVAPARLEAFAEGLRVLRTDPNFSVKEVPGLLDAETRARLKETIRAIPLSTMELHEFESFGRMVVHDHPAFVDLQRDFAPLVSSLVGEEVQPSYSFLALYTGLGICEPHLDAPSAKWTLDICIDQSDPWPIHFSQIIPWPEEPLALESDWRAAIKNARDLEFQSKTLAPGDAVIFSGSSQWHYRDALPATNRSAFCDLLFFHYIPKGADELVNPQNWARLFDAPELQNLPNLEKH